MRRRRSNQPAGTVGALKPEFIGFKPVLLPEGIVRIVQRQRLQCRPPSRAQGGVAFDKLLDEQAKRPSVCDDVMQRAEQDVMLRCQPEQRDAQQRPPLQVEGRVPSRRAAA